MRIPKDKAALVAANWPQFAEKLKTATEDGDFVIVELPKRLSKRRLEIRPSNGVGTELKKLLALAGIFPNGCGCDGRALVMDAKGISWCQNNISIIVGWLAEEAKQRKLHFSKVVGYGLVYAAITAAKLHERFAG